MFSSLSVSLKFFLILVFSIVLPQIIKLFLEFKKGKFIEILFETGGMPSSHASLTVAITSAIALSTGFSPIFFLALAITLLTLRDAVGVRFAVGEQAKAINEIRKELKMVEKNNKNNKIKSKLKDLKIIRGHTLPQILVGSIIGLAIALIVWFV